MEGGTEKACTGCGHVKPPDGFYQSDRNKCKDCKKAYSQRWRESNRERHRKSSLQWFANNKEHVKKRMRAWFEANREYVNEKNRQWRKRNSERAREVNSLWKRKNYKVRPYLNTAFRSAQKRAVTPGWANIFFIEEIYDLARRRTEAMGFEWHVDHIVPINSPLVCGLHVEHNLRVIPATENLRKRNASWPDMP